MSSIKNELDGINATPTINHGKTYLKQGPYLNHISIDKIIFKQTLRATASLLGGPTVLTEPHSSKVISMELKSMFSVCCHSPTVRCVWQRCTRKTYKGSFENKGRMEPIVLKITLISHRCKRLRKHRKSKNKALVPPNFLVFVFIYWQFIHNRCSSEWASVCVSSFNGYIAVQF